MRCSFLEIIVTFIINIIVIRKDSWVQASALRKFRFVCYINKS